MQRAFSNCICMGSSTRGQGRNFDFNCHSAWACLTFLYKNAKFGIWEEPYDFF